MLNQLLTFDMRGTSDDSSSISIVTEGIKIVLKLDSDALQLWSLFQAQFTTFTDMLETTELSQQTFILRPRWF